MWILHVLKPNRIIKISSSPFSYQASSATSSRTGFSPDGVFTVAWLTSGYWVDEWFPQIIAFLTSETWTFSLSEIWPKALLWSSLVKQVMFFSGIDGANSFKINALVFAGLATTKTCKGSRRNLSIRSGSTSSLTLQENMPVLFMYGHHMDMNSSGWFYS